MVRKAQKDTAINPTAIHNHSCRREPSSTLEIAAGEKCRTSPTCFMAWVRLISPQVPVNTTKPRIKAVRIEFRSA